MQMQMRSAADLVPKSAPWRRAASVAAGALVPGLAVVAFDFVLRGAQLTRYRADLFQFYLGTAALSLVLWAAAVSFVASLERARVLGVALLASAAMLVVGSQIYCHGRYGAYLNHRAAAVGMSVMPSVGQQIWTDRATVATALGAPALVVVIAALLSLRARRKHVPDAGALRRASRDVLVAAVLASFFAAPKGGDQQSATPDVLYMSALGELAAARWRHEVDAARVTPGPRHPLPVPTLRRSADVPPRDVVFIVTESVRASDTCVVPGAPCTTTPFTDALLPKRYAFSQMRALASTTAISLAVLWSGLGTDASREAFHTMPLAWDYAAAAGVDGAYFTAQNLFFANAGTWLDGIPARHRVSATQLTPYSTYEIGADERTLVDYVVAHAGELRSPYFAVVHLSNTHAPYLIDPDDAPFQPQVLGFGPGPIAPIHNRYKDAIHRQDKIVARLVRELRARGHDRTVFVFTSDHGEQMRERGALTHTTSVIDPEVRVPFWIDAPPGTLTPAESAALAAQRDTPRTMLDVLPTLLDLMGVWDALEIAPFRGRLAGASLLRGGSDTSRPVLLSNCSELFACAFKNWGAIAGTRKLLASQNDAAWQCYDIAADPDETRDLGAAACADLRAVAEGGGRGTPF